MPRLVGVRDGLASPVAPDNARRVPVPSVIRAAVFAPYLAVFYPFLAMRRAAATWRPERGGAWRTWIAPRLLLGGFLYPSDVPVIARDGVSAVVNVSRELVEPRAALTAAGLSYLQVPCWDGRAPALDDAHRGVSFIAGHVAAGRAVYVHCASGVGRSVALSLCYLCSHEGVAVDAALAVIARARPRVSLSHVQRAFVDEYLGFHGARAGSATG